ncbi:MAG TPA: acetate--CoA ligase family protein [Polyangiaceae bacterium]|nr:acetate--CoA ligase family protein [Polyangiaceae bacterium]
MASSRTNLERLFAPASVAVVGASASPEKAGYQAMLALSAFGGDVFAINPKGGSVLGRTALPSLRALSRPVDLVVFAVPAPACVEAVREAIECGCGGGLIVSGGFSESGAAGAALEAELERSCRQSGFRLLGPNTAGFVNKQLSLTASFLPSAERIPSGHVAVVAQSAGINLTVSFLLAKLGYGVSCAVGLGNSVDVDAADVLEFVAGQPETKSIALHLEGVRDGRRLYEAILRISPVKPITVFTVGKTDIGEFARSHTGNLIGSYALRSSALEQAGAVLVESTEELAIAAAALSLHRLSPKPKPGVGVITAQAGAGLAMLDLLKSKGVAVPMLTAPTRARIGRHLSPMTYQENPVDTGRPGPSFAEVVTAVAQDDDIDAVITYALSEPAALLPSECLPAIKRGVTTPILFGTMGPRDEVSETSVALRAQGFYVAESPEELARAGTALARDAAQRARVARRKGHVRFPVATLPLSPPDEHTAKQTLDALGIPTPRRVVCATREDAREALRQLEKPVVAKILSPEIEHKTELGGVQLNVRDEAALDAAIARLDAIPLTSRRRYLIEEMAPAGLELIVSATRDVSFGPTVMVGLGGTFAEALRDTVTRLAPLGLEEAEEMLEQLRAAPLLAGWRGGPKLDRTAVARCIVALGDFLNANGSVRELEINPLRVYPSGVLALDALLILERSAALKANTP